MARKLAKKGSHRSARSTKGWSTSAPKKTTERWRAYKRCGAGAFLRFNRKDPAASGYPIVGKRARGCKPDCRGLRTAYSRAKQFRQTKIAGKAIGIARRAGCAWAD